ncbi:hypothetical protein QJ857_gp0874 [Tupanvirus soda lake]|uniref:NADAR domain-containing protein n=2 Tax=Tupanvirus TaxID=2094720 RepID=A0A6N1NUH2_9VIRU|nr:hypothetical protein QJ857_gp0874 [Tupanvirus soda lake]QKU35176.1 hypothetical protein [Tupanvirus soda lake]
MDIKPEDIDFSIYFKQYGFNKNSNFVAFYGNKGQDIFGNFYELSKFIKYNDVVANNIEALYHSCKFSDPNIKTKFNKLTGLQAFYLSRKYKNYVRTNWDDIKDSIMLDLLRIKFSLVLPLTILLSTGSRYLVEHNPVQGRDCYWSDNRDGSGKNKLGILLMKIRGEKFGTGIVEKPTDYLDWLKIQNN